MNPWISVKKPLNLVTRTTRKIKRQLTLLGPYHVWQKYTRTRYRSIHVAAQTSPGLPQLHPRVSKSSAPRPRTAPPTRRKRKRETQAKIQRTNTRSGNVWKKKLLKQTSGRKNWKKTFANLPVRKKPTTRANLIDTLMNNGQSTSKSRHIKSRTK